MTEQTYVTRLAPSPTGALHLGNARTFLLTWLRAKSKGGRVLMRLEDLDHPRVKKDKISQVYEDLLWMGLDWEGEPLVQSQRNGIYEKAFECLWEAGLIYPCICSRADIESAQSAPNLGDDLVYSNICRGRFASHEAAFEESKKNSIAWRFNIGKRVHVEYIDNFRGKESTDLSLVSGDFVIARTMRNGEVKFSYQLACVVDDYLTGVTEVIRADDLVNSTFRQIELYKALSYVDNMPEFMHLPLVVGKDGRRLAKRHGDTRISCLRQNKVAPELLLGWLGWSCGFCEWGELVSADELRERFVLEDIPKNPLAVEEKDLAYLGFL